MSTFSKKSFIKSVHASNDSADEHTHYGHIHTNWSNSILLLLLPDEATSPKDAL